MEILNRDLSPVNMNNFTLEYVNLDLNWHKFINVNKLGYRLVLINNGKEEAQWTFVGDSKPEYVLSRLKPNYTYTVRITPVSCKLQVDFNINTPRLISDKEAIALINMIQREEKNLTNIRNIGISFKNDLINHTGYILDVELLTRYNEGSKTVLVQIVNLIPDIKRFTISNLKPCSIYKLTVHKEERLILEVSKATSLFHSFYIFTGYTDDFKSNIPVAQSIQTTGMMYNSGEKYSHLKSIGITPRKTVTCYVENESPFSGFACRNSDICVPLSWVCDGEDDCVDGDDELNCRSHNFPDQLARNICRKNEFRCYTRGDYVCLPISWLCDGRQDCADGWDENRENCRTPFNRPGSTAYNANAVTCDRDYFRCFNGLGCVAPGFVCDGDQDCSDGSDEWGCKTNSRCNGRYEFQCFNDDLPYNPYSQYRNHRCIPKSWVCDDQDDCPNGEDESFETCNVVRRLGTASGLFSVIKKIVDPFTYY
ncbi:uncharacterized protein LOC142322826 [Lycorma delicatula]|uniref:uncharacterized protein LOC142322826 n=1 Tax=Lycorma delicatula TaxID=130591 RepID=UPI003F51428D